MLVKYNLTADSLAQYYKDNLRLRIHKSLMRHCLVQLKFEETLIDSILLQGKTELIKPNRKKTKKRFEGTKEQHDIFKKKDRKVRRTINDFERIMFPGVRMDPRGGYRLK